MPKYSNTPRQLWAKMLRDMGCTYAEIGADLGISPQRARQLVQTVEWHAKREERVRQEILEDLRL